MSNIVLSEPAEVAETICAEFVATHPRRPQISEAIRRALVQQMVDDAEADRPSRRRAGYLFIFCCLLMFVAGILTGRVVWEQPSAAPTTMVVSR